MIVRMDRRRLLDLACRLRVDTPLRALRASVEGRSLAPILQTRGFDALDAKPKITLVAVARASNARTLLRLLQQLPRQVEPHLHFLDNPPTELAGITRSTGPGLRMEHLADLVAQHHVTGRELIIADDDVVFTRGNGQTFITVCRVGGFDVAQPSHGVGSQRTFPITRTALFSRARKTNFVEVGPLLWMSARAQRYLLPLNIGAGMGWGVDLDWAMMGARRLHFGLIDAAPIIHSGAVGAAYGASAEYAYLNDRLAHYGLASVLEFFSVVAAPWRSWQRRPPWLD